MSRRHIEAQLIEVRADQQAADARLLVAIGQEHKAHDKYLTASTAGDGEELVASLWLMRRDRWRDAQEDARKSIDDDQRVIDRLLDQLHDLLPAPRTASDIEGAKPTC